jgi:hypothetical protein
MPVGVNRKGISHSLLAISAIGAHAVLRFVSPRASQGQMTDATMCVTGVDVEFEDAGDVFRLLLEAARGFGIRVEGAKVSRLLSICRSLRIQSFAEPFWVLMKLVIVLKCYRKVVVTFRQNWNSSHHICMSICEYCGRCRFH